MPSNSPQDERRQKAMEIVAKHRRHVELSPGAGASEVAYALAVLEDVANDLAALPPPAPRKMAKRNCGHDFSGGDFCTYCAAPAPTPSRDEALDDLLMACAPYLHLIGPALNTYCGRLTALPSAPAGVPDRAAVEDEIDWFAQCCYTRYEEARRFSYDDWAKSRAALLALIFPTPAVPAPEKHDDQS